MLSEQVLEVDEMEQPDAVEIARRKRAAGGLTSQDIKALKQADTSICFDHIRGTSSEFGSGHGQIRAHKRQEVKRSKSSMFSSDTYLPDAEYIIPCHSKIQDFLSSWNVPRSAHCYSWQQSYNEVIKTLIAFLKAGDVLNLLWYRNNDSDYIRDKGLNRDELRLQVIRNGVTHTFLVESSCCPDNTARMTQYR